MRCIFPGCESKGLNPFCDEHAGSVPEKLHAELYEKAQEYWMVRLATQAWIKLNNKVTPTPEEIGALGSRL